MPVLQTQDKQRFCFCLSHYFLEFSIIFWNFLLCFPFCFIFTSSPFWILYFRLLYIFPTYFLVLFILIFDSGHLIYVQYVNFYFIFSFCFYLQVILTLYYKNIFFVLPILTNGRICSLDLIQKRDILELHGNFLNLRTRWVQCYGSTGPTFHSCGTSSTGGSSAPFSALILNFTFSTIYNFSF